MLIPSVVVHDFDVDRANARPYEADSPLVVDANTVLTLSITLQCLKAIARWRFQKVQSLGCIELSQLSFCDCHECLEPSGASALVQRLRVFAVERLDHAATILRGA
jgi:hypothetical protein